MVVTSVGELAPEQLRLLAMGIRDRIGPGVVVLGATNQGKAALIATVSKGLVEAGLSAASIIGAAAKLLGGGGSRDPELAQAGGPNGSSLSDALSTAAEAAAAALRGV